MFDNDEKRTHKDSSSSSCPMSPPNLPLRAMFDNRLNTWKRWFSQGRRIKNDARRISIFECLHVNKIGTYNSVTLEFLQITPSHCESQGSLDLIQFGGVFCQSSISERSAEAAKVSSICESHLFMHTRAHLMQGLEVKHVWRIASAIIRMNMTGWSYTRISSVGEYGRWKWILSML